MCATFGANGFGSGHAMGVVCAILDLVAVERLIEARPTAACVVLRLGREQLDVTHDAVIRAVVGGVVVLTGERPLGASVLGDLILLGREPIAELRVGRDCGGVDLFVLGHSSMLPSPGHGRRIHG